MAKSSLAARVPVSWPVIGHPTDDDVPITRDGRRLDTLEKLIAFLEEINATRDASSRARRSRRCPQPPPTARLQRQPLQQKPVQDTQILPRVPRPVRFHRRRPQVLHDVLHLLQPRARHSGIGLHTPASVHYGTATEIREQRAAVLDAAYAANPTRFHHRRPTPPKLPTAA
jgi:hypothetical protein